VPRRRRWWRAVPGLGATGARHVEAFFAAHPALTARAWQLVVRVQQNQIEQDHPDAVLPDTPLVPWEQLTLPVALDGSHGRFRAPASTCLLDAANDCEAVQSWLALHESPDTQRAYRKEAERLILWALVESQCALSSLTTDDAIAYRAFLRRPAPRARWTGPSCPRSSPDWRPFVRGLSARSAAYALSVLRALFRWLIEQRYVLANPFAGIRVRGAGWLAPLDSTRVLTGSEWAIVRSIADGFEVSCGWSTPAAQRLRFLLDLDYATGLRAHELVTVTLGDIHADAHGDTWLTVTGKGAQTGKGALPPLALEALDRSLLQRGLPVTRTRWKPGTSLVTTLEDNDVATGTGSITATRLRQVMQRFFVQAAALVQDDHPVIADKLRRASPHWMRHTHATHALALGVELDCVRDNLRHASIATTSTYLHGDDAWRAR
jgi:site-specific recombinase XerD